MEWFPKIKWKELKTKKNCWYGLGFLMLAFFVGGFLEQLLGEARITLNPFLCIFRGISTSGGIKGTLATAFLFFIIAAFVIWRGESDRDTNHDEERNFDQSEQGTYGTAGYMEKEEQSQVLHTASGLESIMGIIFGRELDTGEVVSLPVDSRLNRNIAVCGSQGSMKSRAFARVMALQCIRRGESMYFTDPKSGARRSCLKRVGTTQIN